MSDTTSPQVAAAAAGRPQSRRFGGPPAQALRQVLVANRDAQQALAAHLGLGGNDLSAMEHLLAAPDGLGPADLAERLGIRSASATVLVDRLEQAGHVTRSAHASDRRRTVVTPTDHARDEVIRALVPLIAAVDAAADGLTPDEQATVTRFLSKAADNLRQAAADLSDRSGLSG